MADLRPTPSRDACQQGDYPAMAVFPQTTAPLSRLVPQQSTFQRAYRLSRKDRKKVEILFAHLKCVLKLDRLRLRGPSGPHDEFLLAATAQNLRRMAKRLMPKQEKMAVAAA
ncbi:transposase [Paraburkholderia phosphatilytica]|uniref:transposase n=1 Tax=Paraburkholderia phosphatilytica TaxID=2282883 RepID=UPI0023E8F343|nr:transposase [Paraburkholderia phosphatilytica]